MTEPDFQSVADLLTDTVWLLTAHDLQTSYVNGAVRESFGVEPDAVLGEADRRFALIHPDDRDKVRAAYLLPGTGTSSLHYRLRLSQGEERLVVERFRPVSVQGTPGFLLVVSSDRTKDVQAEKAIRDARNENAEQSVLHLVELAQKNDRLQQELFERKRAEQVKEVLAGVSEKLNLASSPTEAATVILEAADELFTWDAAMVDVFSPEENAFYGVIRFDLVDGKRAQVAPQPGGVPFTEFRRELFRDGARLVLREQESQDPQEGLVAFGEASRRSASLMFAPITKGSRIGGMLSIQSYTPAVYNAGDLELFQILANYCCTGLERTFAEERLHEAEQRLRLIQSTGCVVQWTTDRSLRITSVWGEARMQESLPGAGKPAADLGGERNGELVSEAHHRALGGETAWVQITIAGKPYECRIDPLRNPAGEIVGALGTGLFGDQINKSPN